jgi:hypothetical protein
MFAPASLTRIEDKRILELNSSFMVRRQLIFAHSRLGTIYCGVKSGVKNGKQFPRFS